MNTQAIKNVPNRFNFQTMPVDGGWHEYTVHQNDMLLYYQHVFFGPKFGCVHHKTKGD